MPEPMNWRQVHLILRSGAVAIAALLCLAGARQTPSQTVDDIVLKHLTAKGGLEKLKAIQTIKQTATLSMQGNDAIMTISSKRPNQLRQEVFVDRQFVINGFDGVTAWILNPNVSTRAIIVTGPQAEMIKDQSSFDGPLVDYKSQGYTIVMDGVEVMGAGERRVIHLRLTSRTAQRSHLYLDADTFLEAKLTNEMNQLKLDQEFSDFRDKDGIKVPYLIRTLTNGVLQSELKVQLVEFNVPMDDALFRPPKGS